MIHQRWRPVLYCALAIAVIWAAAFTIYRLAESSKVTAEKAKSYAESIDLSRLSTAERAKALRRLADMLNRLPLEERRRARLEGANWRLLEQMTEDEKGAFIEATMPTPSWWSVPLTAPCPRPESTSSWHARWRCPASWWP